MRNFDRYRWFLLAVILAVLALLAWGVSSGAAQDDDAQATDDAQTAQGSAACYPLDVVFLVDYSASMGGDNGGIPTDPATQRRYAIEAVIDLLSDIALDLCPDVTHRIAVVSFGTTAEIDIPLTEIDPDDSLDSERIRGALKEQIVVRNLGATHPKPAFERAAEILRDAGPITDEIRKRAIIFVTDGEPCFGDGCLDGTFDSVTYSREMRDQIAEDFPFDPTLLQQEECLKDLRMTVGPDEDLPQEGRNECLDEHAVPPETYASSTYVWVILLRNQQSYRQRLRDIFEEIAETHGGELIPLSNNRQEVPTTFRNILEQLTGVRAARLSCGNFAVNPYLKRARLVFYKFDASVEVSLSYTDVDGDTFTIEGGEHNGGFDVEEYYRQGANERYVLIEPYPGIWQMRSENCDGLDAFYDPIEFDPQPNLALPAAFPQRDRPPYYDTEAPYYINYQMLDESGQIVTQAEHEHFALDLEITVTEPDGEEKDYPMEWIADESLFRSTEPLQVQHTGAYTVTAIGTTNVHEGEPTPVGDTESEVFDTVRVLFEDRTEFRGNPVTSFVIEVLEPAEGETLKPVHGPLAMGETPPVLPLTVRTRIVDRQGQATIPLDEALANSATALRATVTADGDSESVSLQPDLDAPGEFVGSIEGFDAIGDHELEVALVGDFAEAYYPDNRRANVSFQRIEETWRFDVMTPGAGEELRPIHHTIRDGWPLVVNPIPVRVQLVDEDGQPYGPDHPLIDYAPDVLMATVSAGEMQVETELEADPEHPGQYSGTVEGMEESGEHTVTVDVPDDFGSFTAAAEPGQQTFSRADGLLNLPATYYAILILIILFVLYQIYRYFAIRSNPLTGELAFVGPGGAPISFGLYSGKNWTAIKPKVLEGYPQLELKKLKVINSKAAKSKKEDEDEILGSSFSMGTFGDGGSVRVEFETESGQKDSMMLPPNTPVPYGQSTVFQMEYRPDGS